MSQNQIKGVKKGKQYRKTGDSGRTNNNTSDQLYRSFSTTGRGGSSAPLSSDSASTDCRQSRGHHGSVNTTSGPNPASSDVYPVVNCNRVQSTLHASSAPAQAAVESADTSSKNNNHSVSKVQASSMTPDSTVPLPPPEGGGKAFPLQFGSIIMEVPARTISAPPGLDEQKRDQEHSAAARAAPANPVPNASKQKEPQKHVHSEPPIAQETHTVSEVNRDVQLISAPSSIRPMQGHRPALHPMAGMPVPIPYQPYLPPPHLPFCGPNLQIPAHQMPMPRPPHLVNPPQVQQRGFLPGLPHHPNQGIIHQGPSFGFNPHLGPPFPHHPGNLAMPMPPPFSLPQPGNGGNARKTVKITHPETREELRLDKIDGCSPSSRSHQMGPQPFQSVPSYAPMHPSGYFSAPYTPGPPVFPVPNSFPPTSTQLQLHASSQAFKAQPTMLFMNQSTSNALRHGGSELSNSDLAQSVHIVLPSVTSPPMTVKAAADITADKGTDSDTSVRSVEEAKADVSSVEPKSDSSSLKESNTSVRSDKDVVMKENVVKLDSMKDIQQPQNKDVSVAASTATPSVDLGAANAAEKDHDSKHGGGLLQETEQNGEKEVGKLPSGHGLKTTYIVKRTAGSEASQGESESVKTGIESDKIAPVNVSKLMLDNEAAPASVKFPETNLGNEVEIIERSRPASISGVSSVINKTSADPYKIKNNRGKKKRKEMLQKADALGTSSDLYMAYKGPEEKEESGVSGEGATTSNLKCSLHAGVENCSTKKKDELRKLELEDWEDAVDGSTPKLESSVRGDNRAKKYSRDFLLTFSEQCTDLPDGFQIMPDIADILSLCNASGSHNNREYGSSGKKVDRAGAARHDHCVNGMMNADRWDKSGAQVSNRDPGIDLGYGNYVMGFRPNSSPNYGVRNIQHPGGVLSGPSHSMGFQGTQSNYPETERWKKATGFNKGLMPVPQSPALMMHRAENKYEVGKVSDEEQAKQRRLKAILNKLTPQNFNKLFAQVKEVNIDNVVTLSGVISQIFDKALTEPTFCEMYANFCHHLASELPDLSVDDEKITFKRLLLNKCQEEFERNEREEEEANKADGDIEQTEEEREQKRLNTRRRMLGNIRLIGELYKKRMLTERIMHECIKKLLGQYQNPDEENIEALCKLMSTIGVMIDHYKAKEHMDAYFDIMGQLSNNMKLSSRVRFMLKDAIDLRKNKWQQRRKVEGPKKIEEVHRDAAQERLGQAGRFNHGQSLNSAMRRGQSQTVEYIPKGSMLSSSVGPMGGFRSSSTQVRGYGGKDIRMDDGSSKSRILSVPSPHRSLGDQPITLGPQGGLAKGMSCRGKPPVSGSNGFNSALERGVRTMEDQFTRQTERFDEPVAHDHSDGLQPDSMNTIRDVKNPNESIISGKVWPEEHFRDKSVAAIKEFYSANDEKEVALCIKDLNAPKFNPTVISIWVADAYERKDLERDMLAKLLVNLTKARDDMFSPQQLIKGFELVLENLEDTVIEAPKAPEYLGRILAKVIIEDVLPLKDVARLIHKGGEQPGRLLEIGLAGDVLGNVLETIKSEKGELTLMEIQKSSDLQIDDFRPPNPLKSKKLELFLSRI
ncbi:eukaryotic translation initiation factor 4G-like isoform X2 [Amaranthus tricolor]|uniref:eukaryotic translation initiation factor 4G-like isoform X2 n=1 Tax=Amaranthus tricolor TaxID=29722 RepID=UPI002584A232|nr:eukaryotic translation initiation factor 4G-like isoform X2 [Amaranthus tricolor]